MSDSCPNCTQPVKPGAKFCPTCGHALTPPARGAPQATKHISGSRLELRFPGKPVEEVPLGNTATIGRESGNTIVIPLATVSRQHAQIVLQAGRYAVIDLGSSNGTYLQGIRIPANTPQPLTNGAVIRIGDKLGNSVSLTYLDVEGSAVVGGTISLGTAQLGSISRFTIGRDPQSHLHLDTPTVSWHHAVVLRTPTGHTLQDLGSTNGTYVNGSRVRTATLNSGDQVQIGSFKLVYSPIGFEQSSLLGSVRVDGIRLHKEVPAKGGKKAILNNVSLSVMPREFIALVGGSGAGKTTLMDALNGFRRAQGGRVLVNGEDLYRNYDAYRSNMGYVPQNDILHTGLTVRHALRYTAMLRLPPDTSWNAINQRIEYSLKQVDMLPQIDQPITSLSGGQRKRVSIAAELLSDPSLFFLDEPTSGLDPGLDKRMMFTLNTLADSGRTIVLTTHATNNIMGQCDHVAFMSHGRLVYYGPPQEAIKYFGVLDFADIYSKVDTPQDAVNWENQYHTSSQYQQLITGRQAALQHGVGVPPPRRVNLFASFNPLLPLRQFIILAWRYLDLIFNSAFRMFILLAVMPIIGFLLLLIANGKALVGDSASYIERVLEKDGYYNIAAEAQILLFMMGLSVILLGVFAAAYEIVRERQIYKRERMVNLGVIPYLSSKAAVLLGFGLMQCLALMIVVALKVYYPLDGVILPAPFEIYITLVLAMLSGVGMGMLISALVKNESVVIYLVLVVLFVQIIFSGVLFNLPGAAKSLSYITSTRWAMEGLGASVNMDRLNDLTQSYIEDIETDAGSMQVNKAIDSPMDFYINYDNSAVHLLGTWLVQLFFAAFFFTATGVVLKLQDYSKG